MKGITKITVTMHGLVVERASAGWESGDARFHVWFDPVTRTVEPGHAFGKSDARLIYKNSTADHGQPGYFPTRKLDADSPGNVAILEHVFETINREGLIAKARAAKKEAARVEAEKQADLLVDSNVEALRAAVKFLKKKAPDELISALDMLSLDDLDAIRARFP